MNSYDALSRFFFELGMLKNMQRSGWSLLGLNRSESVADHSLRAAQIGYILAHLEGHEHPEEVVTMIIFHEIGECRTGDIHKVANRYVTCDEKKAVIDQLRPLDKIGEHILMYWDEMENVSSPAGRIAKDADLLEMVVTSIEIMQRHGIDTSDWIENTMKRLNTSSAKTLVNQLRTSNPSDWWKHLKKF